MVSWLLTLAACGGSADGNTANTGGSGGSGASGGGSGCTVPDLQCPTERPFIGAACATTQVCQYPDGNQVDTWTYTCEAGRWLGEATCEPVAGGSCPVPPLVEKCSDPFDGSTSGAVVELGPANPTMPFTPFAEGQAAPITWGGQGSPMLSFRVRVSGADDVACARLDMTTTVDGQPGLSTALVKLHCGESLSVFTIVDLPCDPGVHTLDLTVEVQGVGTATAKLTVDTPGCLG